MRIAVDAMGGDHAPSVIVDGAVAAARHLDAEIVLVGPTGALERALAPHADWARLGITIADAPDVIGMSDAPAAALRRKPRASIRVAAELVARRDAAALVSMGHTGATVLSAHAVFGMVNGVDRPALAATIPTRARPAVLLDAGASVECRPQHLLQFGVMGSVVARVAFGVERPRVGLLSIGEEETKGNELTRDAHQLLKAAPINFIGNIEGREIYSGVADVVVCDGFTGNVVLKTSEGLVETVESVDRHDVLRSEPSATRLLRVRRRRPDWRCGADHRRPRPVVGESRAECDCDGLPVRDHGLCKPRRAGDQRRGARQVAFGAGVPLSRTGFATGRHGQGAG